MYCVSARPLLPKRLVMQPSEMNEFNAFPMLSSDKQYGWTYWPDALRRSSTVLCTVWKSSFSWNCFFRICRRIKGMIQKMIQCLQKKTNYDATSYMIQYDIGDNKITKHKWQNRRQKQFVKLAIFKHIKFVEWVNDFAHLLFIGDFTCDKFIWENSFNSFHFGNHFMGWHVQSM